ncbi:hypothetical protein BU204_11840 [Actinophytocola xanthii]|uniref:HTH cro/C1-type domain-containing protein n=2 Tax=Actinophytocola xanthii TaxID=1912961 RepID=A0A1Q8CSG1_9PSEU|nr:hypothetical protein BU204_11840 [Actinophytocola xanthii]
MSHELAAAFGERVRLARQAIRKSQTVVAGLAGITADYLYQIERGKKLPALPVVVQLAHVLGVSVSDLLGETTPTRTTPPLESGESIHRALTHPSTTENSDVDVAGLRDQVHAAWHTWQTSAQRYSRLADQLPPLITSAEQLRKLRSADHATGEQAAQACAVDLYGLVRTFAKRVGRVDLALLAAERGITAAETANDPVRLASARWNLAHVLLAQYQPEGAEAVALHAAEAVERHVTEDLDALALLGALRLLAAVASMRLGNMWTAHDRIRSVVPIAERTGERNVCWTAFGPTNVAMYAVNVEVEAGNATEGLRLAERIQPEPTLSIERRVAFRLDQAKGYNQRQDYAGALVMLQAASTEAPEDLKYRPAARTALNTVVQRARGDIARRAAHLATRLGAPVA